MAGQNSTETIDSREGSLSVTDREDKLSRWLFFSFLLHGAVIVALFMAPFLPSTNGPSYPIYTVDLVGGEKIGGNNLGTELVSPATPEESLDRVRERLIQSAVDRAKNRTEAAPQASKGEAISAGQGEGEGAAALGAGGRGGGVVKGMEFIIYQNRMLSSIKDNWTWVGQKTNLKVVVHFSIKDNGEISGLKIVQPSGDPSYDESVLRAVKKSSPLPPPPDSSRKDFADVELTFRPKDLGA